MKIKPKDTRVKEFKHSYNKYSKYSKIYRLEIFDGTSRRFVCDEYPVKSGMSANVINTNNTPNNPFVPYWKYEIKWALLKFKDEIRES